MTQGFNNLDFNNIYRNWLQGQIETANARGLMGGQTPIQIINQDLMRPIDNIINQAKSDMVKPNRGIMVGNQNLVSGGPTSISTPKKLPSVYGPNFQLGQEGTLNLGGPTSSSLNKQLPMTIKSGSISKIPVKGVMDPLSSTLMLLGSWYGKDKYGTVGPGRAVLDNSLIPLIKGILSTKEQRDKAKQEYIDRYKPEWIGSIRKPSGGNNNGNNSTGTGGKDTSGMGGKYTTQAQALALAQQLSGNAPIDTQQETGVQQANINAINDYIQQLKDINQPYVDALQNYLNNYDRLARDNYARNRYWQGIASITGNHNWAKMANDYNPIANEANKINTIKTLQEAEAGNVNAINEVMGNLAMAQEMGLPPEAAFANKNLLTMMAAKDREDNKYRIALENNLMKKYGIDRNYARALAVQTMRGQNALDVANIYMGSGVAPGLNMQGTPANNQDVGLQQILQNAQKQNNR